MRGPCDCRLLRACLVPCLQCRHQSFALGICPLHTVTPKTDKYCSTGCVVELEVDACGVTLTTGINTQIPRRNDNMTLSNLRTTLVRSSLTAIVLVYATNSLAGSATVESPDGTQMVFEYADGNKLRLNMSQDDTYMLVRDNTLFAVSYNEGQPMVVNASTMMKGFADLVNMAEQAAPAGATAEVVSIAATGRSETVAGIKGEIYTITTREDGEAVAQEVVMSSDARALEFRDALFTMVRASTANMDEELRRNSDDFRNRLGDMNMGILRYGTEMKVSAIDGSSVAASRFELPAEPIDMSNLGGILSAFGGGGAADDAEDGESGVGAMFSDMMEKFGTNKDGSEIGEADKEPGPAAEAGEAVGKAFKKLFGK